MGDVERRHGQRLSAVPLFLFAAVDLVVALVLLLDSGFSLAFFLIVAIGLVLAALAYVRLRAAPAE
jgi:hypothetical protein